MITHIMKCDLHAHLHDMSAKFDAHEFDAYHAAFDAYNDDLDKLAATTIDWTREYGTARTAIDYTDGKGDVYFTRMNGDRLDIIHRDGITETIDAEDLAVILCYEDCKVTVTANAA